LNEWLTHSEKFINKAFLDRGLAIGIDSRLPFRCLVVNIELLDGTADTVSAALKKQLLLLEPGALLCETITETILLIPARYNESMREFAQQLKRAVERQCDVCISIGIDSPTPDYLHMHEAYLQAQKALQSSLRMRKVPIKFYDEINMEIFADEIPDAAKLEYIHRIFRGYDSSEVEKTIAMLEIFYEEDGSITKSAARFFIHKATFTFIVTSLTAGRVSEAVWPPYYTSYGIHAIFYYKIIVCFKFSSIHFLYCSSGI